MDDFYDEETKGPHDVFELGHFELESGTALPRARLLYKTHGTLNDARDNAILYPHMYSGTPSSLESSIGPGRALDPELWFIICPGQLGNGFSTSPSNTLPPLGGGAFPSVSIADDVIGAHNAHLRVVWLNPKGEALPTQGAPPDHVIAVLDELPALLGS